MLKVLSRITEPTEGRAEIRGRVASLLEVGTGFHPELTGRESVYLSGTFLGMKKAEIDQKLDEIIDFSGVAAFIETPVKHYSSGMYVRLAFAVAAHRIPTSSSSTRCWPWEISRSSASVSPRWKTSGSTAERSCSCRTT